MALKRPGVYTALSAHYADDEAIMAAGEYAELMFVRMLAYASRIPAAEGWISKAVCLTRLGIVSRETCRESEPETRLQALLDVGLISAEDDGYQINSWLKWNRSAEEMGKERSRDRRRKVAPTRADTGTVPGTVPGNGAGVPASVPSADTDTDTDTDERTSSPSVTVSDFDTFWDAYPRKVGKGPAQKAYAKARRKVSADQLLASVAVLARAYRGQDVKYIPHPATWLNGERWTDEPADINPTPPAAVSRKQQETNDLFARMAARAQQQNDHPDADRKAIGR